MTAFFRLCVCECFSGLWAQCPRNVYIAFSMAVSLSMGTCQGLLISAGCTVQSMYVIKYKQLCTNPFIRN